MRINFDKLGMSSAFLCLIHCTVLPIVILALPYFGLQAAGIGGVMEGAFFSLSAIFGFISICFGFKQHRQCSAPFLISIGLLGIYLGLNLHATTAHLPLMVVSALALIGGHFLNHNLCSKSCPSCRIDHKPRV